MIESNEHCDYYFSVTYTRLIVNFKDELFIPNKQLAASSVTDFIATAGSLICLFVGASLLSIIEMLYYLTVRIYAAYRADDRIPRIESIIQIKPISFISQNSRTISHSTDSEPPAFTYLP